MSHIALYRAWRPRTFQDIVGQDHITRTLQNALRERRFTHAYLFSGPRGTGKTSAAKLLAKAVNCEQEGALEPCNQCRSCQRINEGAIIDILEIDAASNRGVDEIRDIRDNVKYAPTEVRYKVYIIDEVHMLTTEAFNALLKTLEEPPAHVIFILATTEPHRLPATIISRCQRFDFRRVALEDQLRRIRYICQQEGIDAEDRALEMIARLSEGGMRDALSLLDQIIAFSGSQVTYSQVMEVTGGLEAERFEQLVDHLIVANIAGVLEWADGLKQEGKSADKSIDNLIYYFRDLLVLRLVPDSGALTERIVDASRMREKLSALSPDYLFRLMDTLNHYQSEMKYAAQPQLLLEVALLKLATLEQVETALPQTPAAAPIVSDMRQAEAVVDQDLVKRMEQLEQRLEQLQQMPVASQAGSGRFVSDLRAGQERSATASTAGTTKRTSLSPTSAAPYKPYAASGDEERFAQVRQRWDAVLAEVKQRKITVHAWLVDGEPVAVYDSGLLVAFKNAIHRETTERSANRQLIEQVMQQQLQMPLRLDTIMQKDWKTIVDTTPKGQEQDLTQSVSVPDKGQPASLSQPLGGLGAEQEVVLDMAPLEPQRDRSSEEVRDSDLTGEQPPDAQPRYEQEWINEAMALFGEDLVTIQKSNQEGEESS